MASPKFRDYFITINEGAESYEDALERVKELNSKLYALIVHDKDNIVGENGELTPKKVHKHLMIELVNPITFQSMQKKFPGSHIEVPKYKKAAYQYLIHNRPNAKEKYQYALEEIISSNLQAVKQAITAEEGLRVFAERDFMQYLVEGIRTPYDFVKAFGLNCYKQYWRPYYEMIQELEHNEEMKRDFQVLQASMEEEVERSLPWLK